MGGRDSQHQSQAQQSIRGKLLMSEPQREDTETPSDREQETDESANGEIDVQALAEKVYELLKEEARVERERLGRRRA
jgi:hypothetical protein